MTEKTRTEELRERLSKRESALWDEAKEKEKEAERIVKEKEKEAERIMDEAWEAARPLKNTAKKYQKKASDISYGLDRTSDGYYAKPSRRNAARNIGHLPTFDTDYSGDPFYIGVLTKLDKGCEKVMFCKGKVLNRRPSEKIKGLMNSYKARWMNKKTFQELATGQHKEANEEWEKHNRGKHIYTLPTIVGTEKGPIVKERFWRNDGLVSHVVKKTSPRLANHPTELESILSKQGPTNPVEEKPSILYGSTDNQAYKKAMGDLKAQYSSSN